MSSITGSGGPYLPPQITRADPARQSSWVRRLLRVATVLGVASCVGACVDGDNRKLPRDAAKSEQPEVYSIIIASDKTPDNAPADRLTEISTEREQVYLFIYWDSLTPGREYMTGWRLFDGADELLLGRTQLIRPASRQWMTWFVIPLSATTASGGRTTLGSWSLIVTADNETVAETQLSVVDVSSEQLQTSE